MICLDRYERPSLKWNISKFTFYLSASSCGFATSLTKGSNNRFIKINFYAFAFLTDERKPSR